MLVEKINMLHLLKTTLNDIIHKKTLAEFQQNLPWLMLVRKKKAMVKVN